MAIPPMSRDQVREVDRLAIEHLGIPGLVLMENAGLNASHLILDLIEQEHQLVPDEATVVVFCGGGNNGGDGYVIARHLHNHGAKVHIVVARAVDELEGDAAINAHVCRQMGLDIRTPDQFDAEFSLHDLLKEATIVVDALLGTGFHGEVRSPLDGLIQAINQAPKATRVAVDIPSGLDLEIGGPSNATVQAQLTITFVAPKLGFESDDALPFVGDLHTVDIGTPPWLMRQVLRPA